MARGPSNSELKIKNERIFRSIDKKLRSSDEEGFVRAADKLRMFISRRQAYYSEARPLIVHICKTARATLTSLARSTSPFQFDQQFPPELQSRVAAYARLIETVLQHASAFEADHHLQGDLIDLFRSAGGAQPSGPPLSRDRENKSSQRVARAAGSVEESRDKASLGVSQISVLTEVTLREGTLSPKEASVAPSIANAQNGPNAETLTPSTRSVDIGETTRPESELRTIENNDVPGPSTPSVQDNVQSNPSNSHASTASPPASSCMSPDTPIIVERSLSEKVPHTRKPAAKRLSLKGKSKLRKFDVPQDLFDEDIRCRTMKRRQSSEPRSPVVVPPTDNTDPVSNALPTVHRPVAVQRDGELQTPKLETQECVTPPKDPASSNDLSVNLERKAGSDLESFNFVCVEYGQDAGNTLSLRFDLTSEQRDSLALWKTRDEHERDVSSGLCVSLICGRKSEAASASTPLELTPSWPTDARLTADIGSSRIFLAPPLQVTHENFVDISQQIDGPQVEVRLDQGGDMREYVFALVLHRPTPPQLHELEEQRARTRSFRASLATLRITAIDVFG